MPELQQAEPHPAPGTPAPRPRRALVAPSRRGLLKTGLGAGLGLGAAGLLTACTATTGTAPTASAGTSTGPWEFTDDRGTAVKLDSAPSRVVAYSGTAAALYDFGVPASLFAAVFGPTKLSGGRADPMAGSLPVDKLTVLGETYGEFDVAKYAQLDPQVLVTNMWETNALWYVPDASASKIEKLAPTIAISVANTTLTQPLAQYEKLAGLLGADLTASRVTAAKSAYQQAAETLRSTAKSQSTIKVLAASASTDLLYVADPSVYPDLSYFQQLGVEFVKPTNVQGGFFESLSWENADKYPADLILLDDRTAALQPEDLTGKPTWTSLPAVKAGQILGWASELRYSYTALGPVVSGFATALQNAKKVV